MKILALVIFVLPIYCSVIKDQPSPRQNFFGLIPKRPLQFCICQCGRVNNEMRALKDEQDTLQGKLIGGVVPSPFNYPWLVPVMKQGKLAANGVLISDRHVLTAASPIAAEITQDVKIRISVHDRCVGETTSSNISIEAIIIHPAYLPASRAHDIALLRLSSKVLFDVRLATVCLPTSRTSYVGEVGTVVSWLASTTGTDSPPHCEPRQISQPILSESECAKITSPNLLTPDKTCIGVIGSTSVICGGDVGAPIQYMTSSGRTEVVGIVTDVNVCGEKNGTVFIKVNEHLNWIQETISNDCVCRI